MSADPPIYDRQLLLNGPKRNEVLELWEVWRYGIDSYNDADYVSIYGLRPAEWYAKGIRLLGRTAVECTRDDLGEAIGNDAAVVAAKAPRNGKPLVVDLFAGSGNTMYWLLRHLPGSEGYGCESDGRVFQLTQRNLTALSLPIDIRNADYRSGMAGISLATNQLLIAFIAPPWGDALDATYGLDLRRTVPPVIEILDLLFRTFAFNKLLCAIQIYEAVNAESLADLQSRFDWSTMRIYTLNAPGQNHGILLGSKQWAP
jgi:hypothetical protein